MTDYTYTDAWRPDFEAWAEENIGQFSRRGFYGTCGQWQYSHNIQNLAWRCWIAAIEAERAKILDAVKESK